MVKFLTTTGVSHQLEEIIKNANDRLILISPYLRMNRRIKDLLVDQDRMKRDIRLVYRNRELQPEESDWLESMPSIRTSYCESLHAKCYLNEREALITSMNLYEFSQVNNDEMGILVSFDEDPDLYKEISAEAMRIVRTSEEVRVTVSKVNAPGEGAEAVEAQPAPANRRSNSAVPTEGFCIRCKTTVPAKPVSAILQTAAIQVGSASTTKPTKKSIATFAGANTQATLLKPVCLSCYRKYKDVFEFAVG